MSYVNFRSADSDNVMSWYIQFNRLDWVVLCVVDTRLPYCSFTEMEEATSLMATTGLASPKLERDSAVPGERVHNGCVMVITGFVGLGMCYMTTSSTTTSCFFPINTIWISRDLIFRGSSRILTSL